MASREDRMYDAKQETIDAAIEEEREDSRWVCERAETSGDCPFSHDWTSGRPQKQASHT